MLDTQVGERYGYWTVTGNSFSDREKGRGRFVPVRCDCGFERNVARYHLQNSLTMMCLACKGKEHSKNTRVPDSGWNTFFYRYTGNAKSRNLRLLLTREEFRKMCEQDCFYCGEPPKKRVLSRSQTITANGIDRIDSSKDYTPDNCVPCCGDCNWMKNNMSTEKFLTQVEKISKHELKRPR